MTTEQAWGLLMDDPEEWALTGKDQETRHRYRSKMNRGKNIPLETKYKYLRLAGFRDSVEWRRVR